MEFTINNFKFNIIDKYNHIEFTEEQFNILKQPSHLTFVLLCSNWKKQTYRLINFNGTTNEDAIKKILTFYNHKTFRRLIGNHIVFEGSNIRNESDIIINLGELRIKYNK